MSRWSEQFANHPIHETLRQLREWVFIDIEDIDSDHEAEQRRLLKAIDTIKAVVEGLDPELFPEAELTQLNNHLRDQNFWNQLNSYSSDGNVGQLKSANDHITSQIHGIFKMAMLAKPPELQRALTVIEEAYDGFCKAIEEAKAGFEQKCAEYAANVAEFDQRITALQQDFDALKQSTEASLAGWQTEFTNAETTRAQEHSDSQIRRSKESEDSLREIRAVAEQQQTEIAEKHDKALQKVFDDFVANSEAKSEDIENKHQSILDIHELVATDSVAGGYKKSADDERAAANTWRIISMLCYALILLWVVFKGKLGFGIAQAGALDWPVIVTTLSVTAVAFVAAQFASRQSRLHRINEQRMRWFSLEVKAIDPFISSLPIEMQQELKRQLSERLFGQDRVADGGPSTGFDPSATNRLLETLITLFKR